MECTKLTCSAQIAGIAPVDPPQVPIMVRQVSYNETSATIAWSMPASSPPASHYKVHLLGSGNEHNCGL